MPSGNLHLRMPLADSIPSNQSHEKIPSFYRIFSWLGRRDSNPRMPVPKTGALPLGHAPLFPYYIIRWFELLIRQDSVTFRDPEISLVKTSFHRKVSLQTATGYLHPRMPVPKTGALPLGHAPMSGSTFMARKKVFLLHILVGPPSCQLKQKNRMNRLLGLTCQSNANLCK